MSNDASIAVESPPKPIRGGGRNSLPTLSSRNSSRPTPWFVQR